MALEAPNADDRRDAVARIGESGYVTSEDAFSILDAAARTDPVSQVRCIAIRAFGRYGDGRPVAPLISILQATPESRQHALPPGRDVTLEAASVLAEMNRRGLVAEEHQPAACALFLKLAGRTTPREVRIVALRALGSFKDRAVFSPLIEALHESDFAVADTAERSLVALTGMTHDYNPDEWERWLDASPEPFARAGGKPLTTRPASPGWWEQERLRWQRAFRR